MCKEIYTNSLMTVHLHKESNNTRRGVRQGDTISSKLFMAALESIFRRVTWETRGLKKEGQYHSHLRFPEDILISPNRPHELQHMLQELAESRPGGQHSPSIATSSGVTLEYAWRDKSITRAYFQQWHKYVYYIHGHSPSMQRTS